MSDSIHGDLASFARADTERMPWTPSPSGTVWRKRVHLVGAPESGQVTSVVRYEPDSTFHAHDHPEGVWTLPPTLALGDKDKAKYVGIGESDRMTLRFRKPAQ